VAQVDITGVGDLDREGDRVAVAHDLVVGRLLDRDRRVQDRLERLAGPGRGLVGGAAVVGRLVGEAAHRHGGRGAGIGDAAGVEVDGAGRAALTRAAGALVEGEADVAGRGATGGGAGHLGCVVPGRTDRRRGDHLVRRVVHVGRGRGQLHLGGVGAGNDAAGGDGDVGLGSGVVWAAAARAAEAVQQVPVRLGPFGDEIGRASCRGGGG